MNPRTWFRVSGSVVSAALLFVSGSAGLMSLICAQSSEPVSAEFATASFLSAPSLHFSGAPTSIATGDLNGDGKLDLVTTDWSSGKVTVSLGLGNGKFAPGVDYAVGSHPGPAIIADIDGDGRADVIVASQTEGSVRVLLGSGNGKLQQAQAYSIGFNPAFIAVGDFNGDGKMDVAVSGGSSRRLAILLNEGGGSFGKPIVRSLSKTSTSFAIADLNQDEHADLILANDDGTISILLGAGDGSFHSTPDVKVAQGPLSSILAADFNRDGKVDLAVTLSGEKQLSVLMGKGNGGFDSAVSYRVGSNPVSIALGDVDEDGISDLVVTNQGSNTFSVLGGNADGTFRSSLDYVAGKGPLAAVAGDFYGASHLDLAIVNFASQSISLPFGNGDGTFHAARAYSVELQPKAVAFGNLTGGKNSDLVVTNFCGSDAACGKNGTVSVMTASESGYRLASTYSLGAGPVAVALVDVDSDKNLDMVALNRNDKTISILLGLGGGSFQQQFTLPLAEAPVAFAVGDFNHDGKTDLAVLGDCGSAKCSQPGILEILYGAGDGSFRSGVAYPVDYSPTAIAVGDLNKDKNLDIVISNSCGKSATCKTSGTATVFLGDASGKFTAGKDVALGNSPSSVALGDLSGRGVLDLLVTRSTDNTVAVLRGVGDGTFQTPAVYNVGVNPGSVAIADFNGDGKLDVAVSNIGDSTVSVLFGKGDGTLLAGNALPVGPGPESLTAIQSEKGTRASLVTANGNSASSTLGTDITVLANIQPEITVASNTVLSALPISSTVNGSVKLTAVVTGSAGTPTGTVKFMSIGTDISGCASKTLDATGTATCTTSALIGGTDSLTASYSGKAGVYDTSNSNTVNFVVTPLTATMTLIPSVTTTPVNGSVTFTAKVSASSTSPLPPSGTVTFKINGAASSECGPQTVDASGKATCTTKSLQVNAGTVTATYGSDDNFTFTGTATSTVTVTPLTATLKLTSSLPTSSNVNESVTFTAAVSAGSVTPTAPAGTVIFKINSTIITDCPAQPVNASGKAVCITSSLKAPSDSVTASYSDDANFTVSAQATLTQTVNMLPATLSLASAPASSSIDQSVTFTASVKASSVTPIAPTGSVSFTINGAASGDCPSQPLNASGQATCTTSSLVFPADVITANYAGDGNFSVTSTTRTASVTETVSKATAKTTLSSSNQSSGVNQSVTFTAAVTPSTGGTGPVLPSGNVTFTQGSTNLCTSVTLSTTSPASATCNYTFTKTIASPGATITAAYSGDSNFAAGTPGTTLQTVGTSGTLTKLAFTPGSPTVNQTVTFTPTVTAANGGSGPSSGTVAITNQATNVVLCSAGVTNGTASTCSYAFGAAGSYSIVANFTSADSNFSGSSSSASSVTVGPSATATTVISSAPSSAVNQAVIFTATVTSLVSGATYPTGTVTFNDGGGNPALCQNVALTTAGGITTAACTYTFTKSGIYPITATFNPPATGANFTASTSGGITQVVGTTTTTTSLVANPNPPAPLSVNQTVTFTASVSAAASGSAAPSGTVLFSYTLGAAQPVNLCNTQLSNKTAQCQTTLPTAGSYSVTAAYSGDANFSGSTSTPTVLTVTTGTTSLTLSPSSNSPVVNDPIRLTAIFSFPQSGNNGPTNTVTFTDVTHPASPLPLCPPTSFSKVANGQATALCDITISAAGTYMLMASYATDSSFAGASQTISLKVAPGTTKLLLASSNPTAVATQAINFTATISSASISATTGAAVPTGTVTFTSSDQTPLCGNVPVTVNASGLYTAACPVAYPIAAGGVYSIKAVYTVDPNFPNFIGSLGTTSQTIQNLSFTISTAGPVYVTQGQTNISDHFAAMPITFTSTPSAGTNYTDTLNLSCTVLSNKTGLAVNDPSCGLPSSISSTLANNGATPVSSTLVVTATSAAAVDGYTVIVTATDNKAPGLSYSVSAQMYIVGQTSPITLSSGAFATEYPSFNTAMLPGRTAAPTSLANFACGTIFNATTGAVVTGTGITCTGPSTVNVTGDSTPVQIQISTAPLSTSTAAVRERTGILQAAGLWYVPLLALALWLCRRGSSRRSFFRFLGMLLLVITISSAIGCSSGSFKSPTIPTGGTQAGDYLVQATATDSNGDVHTAIVAINVLTAGTTTSGN